MQPTSLLAILLAVTGATAQSFLVPAGTDPAVGIVNSFPFHTSDMRYQALITASDLGAAPAVISGFALAPSTTGTRSFASVTMKMAHLSAAALVTDFATNLAAGAVTTMHVTDWQWHQTGDSWNQVDLQVPFVYNGVDHVVVEFVVIGSSGSNGALRREGTNQRVYVGNYAGQTTGLSGGFAAFKMRLLVGDAATGTFGHGCPGGNGLAPELTFGGSSQLGQVLEYRLARAQPNALGFLLLDVHNGPPFPIDLAVHGFPGCLAYLGGAAGSVAVADGQGVASIVTTVPNNPALAGVAFYAQWAVIDTVVGIATSNYGRVLLGS